jgi:UDP-glucose 4-epimerase
MNKPVFVTGGVGFIGSHTCIELLKKNFEIMVFDSLVNASKEALRRVELITNKKLDYVSIYGDDYDTRDGTGERDYIHVTDLAHGHVKALEKILQLNRLQILNLGTGLGTTVRELISTFEKTNNVSISTKVVNRRGGDVAKSYANTALASKLIGFQCKQTLVDMCADTWNWQKKTKTYINFIEIIL